jgi:hypothetical protein
MGVPGEVRGQLAVRFEAALLGSVTPPNDPPEPTKPPCCFFTAPRWRTTVPVRVQCDIAPFPDPSSPAPRRGVPQRDGRPLQYLERSHRADHGRLNQASGPDRPSSTMHWMISSTRRTEQVDNAYPTNPPIIPATAAAQVDGADRTTITELRAPDGIVNLVELAAAEMIDWLLSAGRGWGWWSLACRRMRGSGSRWRSLVTVCGCTRGSTKIRVKPAMG